MKKYDNFCSALENCTFCKVFILYNVFRVKNEVEENWL